MASTDIKSVGVIGGGLVGLATAYRLLERGDVGHVVLFEKERDVGQHQSTHNSGVLHCGLHYLPGSLKAQLAVRGVRQMVEFCTVHGIPFDRCGKVVVAVDEVEVPRLRELERRGTANGLTGLRRLSGSELRELEPHAAGVEGLHVPEEGIVDYAAVCSTLRRLIEQAGGDIRVGTAVRALRRENGGWRVDADSGSASVSRIVNAAGLQADRVARLAGEHPTTRIVPFRGEYWTLRPERAHLVRNLIYPVPDPTFPFLGVHFTRMIHGGVEAGPNAVLALSREGYRWRDISPRDTADALTFVGLWKFLLRYGRTAALEVARSASSTLFLRALQRLVPELRREDIVRGQSGVRAQAVSRSGQIVHDFEMLRTNDAVHVLSAPSPAATSSLAIGEVIAAQITSNE
jgi:(S)-2-hydroxyglutarate dehydrogenase